MKNKFYLITLITIITVGVLLRLKGLIVNPSMWHDECALAHNILAKSYGGLFEKLRFLQVAPPFFLVMSKFLVGLFHVKDKIIWCDFVLRLLPFISSIGSMYIFYFVCKKVLNHKWAILTAMAMFSLNSVLIHYSFDFKHYMTDVLCSLIAVLIFLNVDFKTNSIKKIYMYGLSLALLMWFSFISAIVIAAGFMTVSFKKDNPKLFTSLLMPVFLSGFFYVKLFIANIYAQNSTGMISYWQDEFVKKDFSNLSQLIATNMDYFFSNIPFLLDFLLVVAMIAGFILFLKDGKLKFVSIAVLTFSILIIASVMRYYPFSSRLIIFLIPFVILFISKSIDVKNRIAPSIVIPLLIIPHIIFAFNFARIQNLNKGDFAREMMAHMALTISDDEKILVNEASNVEFLYYNLFVNLKNTTFFEKSKDKEAFLNTLPKGRYWFYMPYDFKATSASNIKQISKWAYENTIILDKWEATQSKLIHLVY